MTLAILCLKAAHCSITFYGFAGLKKDITILTGVKLEKLHKNKATKT